MEKPEIVYITEMWYGDSLSQNLSYPVTDALDVSGTDKVVELHCSFQAAWNSK